MAILCTALAVTTRSPLSLHAQQAQQVQQGQHVRAASAAVTLPAVTTHVVQAAPTATAAEQFSGWDLYDRLGVLREGTAGWTPLAQRENALHERVQTWIATLHANRPGATTGLQLDPLGALYVAAGQDVIARQQFDARLSTPGLSLDDKAYTLLLATTMFARDTADSPRITEALDYMRQLDAMPEEVNFAKYRAHEALADHYYMLGQDADVLVHARKGLALVPRMSFYDYDHVYRYGLFDTFVTAVSGQPNGRAAIDSMVAFLKPVMSAPTRPAEKEDSMLVWAGQFMYAPWLNTVLETEKMIGLPAPAVIATHWYNTPAPTTPAPPAITAIAPAAKQLALNDGTIRLLEFGWIGCVKCVYSLQAMDRIQKMALPGVQTLYVTPTVGWWGATAPSPDEEAEHLRHWYVERHGWSVPIALWAGPKVPQADGGMLPMPTPNDKAFQIDKTESGFMIVDGKGKVRAVYNGAGLNPRKERDIIKMLKHLVAENSQTHPSHPASL